MGLFSLPSKKDAVSSESEFYSRAEEESTAVRKRSRRTPAESAAADPVLPEKKRARRRLVGAVALVLAAIIGLPMILDSEPKPLASDIAIEIPSKDRARAPAAKEAAEANDVSGAAPQASLDKGEEIIDPPARQLSVPPASAVPVSPQTKSASPSSVSSDGIAGKHEGKSAQGPESKSGTKKPEKAGEDDRAKSLLEGKAEKSKSAGGDVKEGKDGKFAVQVAALASQDKVNELQNKLKGAGIKSYTSKVATQSGERIRIRVGPFSSKEEADKMRARLVKLGLGGTLVSA